MSKGCPHGSTSGRPKAIATQLLVKLTKEPDAPVKIVPSTNQHGKPATNQPKTRRIGTIFLTKIIPFQWISWGKNKSCLLWTSIFPSVSSPQKDLSSALFSCDPESKYLMDMIRLAPHLQTRQGNWWQVGFFCCSELIDIRKKNAVLVLAGFEMYLTFHSQHASYIHRAQQDSEYHWLVSETRGKSVAWGLTTHHSNRGTDGEPEPQPPSRIAPVLSSPFHGVLNVDQNLS